MEPRRDRSDPEPTPLELGDPVLRDHGNALRANGERARELTADLDVITLYRRPGPKRWSAGECLDHLVRAGEAYLEVIDEALAEADEAPGPHGAPSLNAFEKVLVGGVRPPVRMRIPAPRRIRPDRPPPEALARGVLGMVDPRERFDDLRRRYGKRLHRADGVDLEAVRVRSPFVPLVRVSLHAALAIIAGHEQRHLEQARAALVDQ